ncbi:PREDICTED: UPF0692 protein C19orf54 homolog, partial [Ficedula albicollis]|uniref:UPF0692 protein C19orf54 homolog n=1 Tax=Ficedula albicollis TaxID=59894 RepID=UPI000359C624
PPETSQGRKATPDPLQIPQPHRSSRTHWSRAGTKSKDGGEEISGVLSMRGVNAPGDGRGLEGNGAGRTQGLAAAMAALAQELLPCRAELLQGGLRGPNRGRVLRHLLRGRALLVPRGLGALMEMGRGPGLGRGLGPRERRIWGGGRDLGRSLIGEESQAKEMPDLRRGSRFGEGSQSEEGSPFGAGSHPDAHPDSGPGSQFEEGSHPESLRDLSQGSPSGSGVPELGRGSHAEPVPDVGRGSRFGAGSPLVLALQGKSPRPQLWALPELGASNAQLSELSPRRWGGGFVLPPGGVRAGLGGRAVLLHPVETPPQ